MQPKYICCCHICYKIYDVIAIMGHAFIINIFLTQFFLSRSRDNGRCSTVAGPVIQRQPHHGHGGGGGRALGGRLRLQPAPAHPHRDPCGSKRARRTGQAKRQAMRNILNYL